MNGSSRIVWRSNRSLFLPEDLHPSKALRVQSQYQCYRSRVPHKLLGIVGSDFEDEHTDSDQLFA